MKIQAGENRATSSPGKDDLVQTLLSSGYTIEQLIAEGIIQEGEYDRVSCSLPLQGKFLP